jgi:autotransporter family porin
MSTKTWTGAISSDWADAGNWGPAGVPGAGSDVTIATRRAVASASIGTVNSITDSFGLRFRSAGTNRVTTVLDNSGELRVDRKGGAGGTILNIAGALTNSGSLRVGNATLSAPDTVTAASLDNTGEIRLLGSNANQALLDVTGAAGFGTAGVLSGNVQLTGDSAMEFASGKITSLAKGGHLSLHGNDAFIEDSTALGSNSALTGLASIGYGAYFDLYNGASLSTTGSLVNHGNVRLDSSQVGQRGGGSSLTLGGR